jgi:uncharacterized membrane protein YoaK (UPF0700 family)
MSNTSSDHAKIEDVEVGIKTFDVSTVTTDASEEPTNSYPSEPRRVSSFRVMKEGGETDSQAASGESLRIPSKELLGWAKAPKAPEAKKAPGRIDDVHSLKVIAGMGGLLCLNSGWVNAVAFRGFDGGITHVTGTATNVGLKLATSEIELFVRSTAKLLTFMFGAMISGGYLGRSRLFKGGPRYAHLLAIVSLAMFAAFGAEFFLEQNFLGALLLALSSGVQNALTTLYSGAVMRTTHVTGTVTDMGIEIGMYLFQNDKSGCWKLKVFTAFLLCYIAGGFLGALCFDPNAIQGVDFVGAQAQAILVPATVTLLVSVIWMVSLHFAEPDESGYGLHAEVHWRRSSASGAGEPKFKRRSTLHALGFTQSSSGVAGAA